MVSVMNTDPVGSEHYWSDSDLIKKSNDLNRYFDKFTFFKI